MDNENEFAFQASFPQPLGNLYNNTFPTFLSPGGITRQSINPSI